MAEKWHNVGEAGEKRVCAVTLGCAPDGTVFPIRCKQWSCAVCAPINALYRAIEVANGIRALECAGLVLKFATITQPATVKTAEFAFRIIDEQWDGFRRRWQRWAAKQDVPVIYAAFVEGQSRRAGMPHFHIVASVLPVKEVLKAMLVKSGFGYQCDVQRIKPGSGVAWYISKYSSKGSDAAAMPKNFRRVRLSEAFPRMVFQTSLHEGEAIVRQRRESVVQWADRVRRAWGYTPADTLAKALVVLEQATGEAAQRQTFTAEVALLWDAYMPEPCINT